MPLAAPVTTQGPRIEHHPRFPGRVNAGYLQVIESGWEAVGADAVEALAFQKQAPVLQHDQPGETLALDVGDKDAVLAAAQLVRRVQFRSRLRGP